MSNEKRKPIETGADIIEWAQQTRDGKGEIFTAFNKKEQLLIAEFILGMNDYIKGCAEKTADAPQAEPPQDTAPVEEKSAEDKPVEQTVGAGTNADFCRDNKTGAQVAYKTFARRLAADPDRYGIFEDGRILRAASFAYWLSMPRDY
jgi:hypothetical protein